MTSLSADEYVSLVLNLDRVRYWHVYEQVLAHEIAAGHPAPVGYYELFAKTREAAGEMRAETMLGNMMRGVR